MRIVMVKVSLVVSLISVLLFIVGWVMQAQKANIDIDTMSAKQFDLLMNIYKVGNALVTVAIYIAAVAAVSWLITVIIHKKI